MFEELMSSCTGFDWDDSNIFKNWEKHNVSPVECEQVFFNLPIIIKQDIEHSKDEARYFILGQTDSHRGLFIVFTVLNNLIRIISARDMTKRKRGCMKTMKKIPKFKSEKEETEFWSKSDSTEYINWKNAGKAVFLNLKPSLKTISLRLPEILLADLKMLANKKDVPYQTLLKTYLADRIEEEMGALG